MVPLNHIGERDETLPQLRSWLFVPANRPDRVAKAFESGADAVIMDLEDACPASEKESARVFVADAVRAYKRAAAFVRINAGTTSLALADLSAVMVPGLVGVMLPKAETTAMLEAVAWTMGQLEMQRGMPVGSVELVPLVESALGMVDLTPLARSGLRRVRRMTFGAGDLTLDLGTHWTTQEAELLPFRIAMVAASRAAGLDPPIDTVWPAISDGEGLLNCLASASGLGFAGKLLIHPSQVSATNEAFTPSAEAVAHARRVISAAAEAEVAGQGAFQLDGRIVDHVIILQARRVLDANEELQ